MEELQRVSARCHADAVAGARQVAQRRLARRREARGVRAPATGGGITRRGAGVAAGAQAAVGVLDEVAQARAVGRGEVDRARAVAARPGLQRGLVGGLGQALGGGLLEHLEVRVQARRERLRAQQARAEAVDRADPAAVDGAGALVVAELGQAAPQPLGELARRLLGEGEREDRVDVDAVLANGGGDPLDHHRGLAGAGVGGQQRGVLAGADRGALLGGPAARRSSTARQIPGCAQPPW